MKKNRVLSALLAVMMILSMLTCIALPAMAETDYTALPKASTATRGDGVNAYQIDSVAELLKVQQVLRLRGYGASSSKTGTANGGMEDGLSGDANYTIWNFEATDTIYLTADGY